MMHWRRGGSKVLPYLDDFMFMKIDFGYCVMLARRVESDFVRAGLISTCQSVARCLRSNEGSLGSM